MPFLHSKGWLGSFKRWLVFKFPKFTYTSSLHIEQKPLCVTVQLYNDLCVTLSGSCSEAAVITGSYGETSAAMGYGSFTRELSFRVECSEKSLNAVQKCEGCFDFFFPSLSPFCPISQNRNGSNLLSLPLVNASLAWPKSVCITHKTTGGSCCWPQLQEMQTWWIS